jgi:hypothetical protein
MRDLHRPRHRELLDEGKRMNRQQRRSAEKAQRHDRAGRLFCCSLNGLSTDCQNSLVNAAISSHRHGSYYLPPRRAKTPQPGARAYERQAYDPERWIERA